MLTLVEAAALLRRGEVTSVELLDAALERADASDAILGAYVHRTDESALTAAVQADRDLAAGIDRGPLHGIPVAVKDNLCTADAPTTAQSAVHDPAWDRAGDATVVARLRAGGAVLTGKLTLSEFAIGPPGPASAFPRPRNPWDPGCWPGGSSSGTGTAVAAGFVFAGLGTDTAGSIRIPSAMCGLTGLKPSFGRVPVSGSIALAPSLDHVGPMARSVADCAGVLQVIAGHDPADPTSTRADVPDYATALVRAPSELRIGVAMPFDDDDDLDPEVAAAFDEAIAVLRCAGVRLQDVVLPDFAATAAAGTVILEAESFALHEPMLQQRWADYSPATRRRLATGAFAGAADLLRAYERRATTSRLLGRLFADVDVVVAPAMPGPAPVLAADGTLDRSTVSRSTRSMRYWNCTGLPALVLPMGRSAGGLPLSLQIVGNVLGEPDVLALGSAFQTVTDWHRAVPVIDAGTAASRPAGGPTRPGPAVEPADAAAAEEALRRRGIDVGDDRRELGRAYALHRAAVVTMGTGPGRGLLAPAPWTAAP